jgi:phosphatidylinositol kinase/protein kinase (PI-3  family)
VSQEAKPPPPARLTLARRRYRELCVKTFMELRKKSHNIIFLVEMLVGGNEDLPCFAGRPDDALLELRDRFKLSMNDCEWGNSTEASMEEVR